MRFLHSAMSRSAWDKCSGSLIAPNPFSPFHCRRIRVFILSHLSASFREQRLEGKAETKGQSDDEGVCEERDESTPNLTSITEQAAATLDPVTERLMAIMREKGQR
jgi:hypothetical protein